MSPHGRQRRTGGARPNSGRWEGLCIPTDIHLYLHSSPSSPTRAHGPLLPPPPRSWGRVSIGRRRRRGDPHGEDEEEGTPMATCTTRPRVWTVCFHSIMHSQAQAPPPQSCALTHEPCSKQAPPSTWTVLHHPMDSSPCGHPPHTWTPITQGVKVRRVFQPSKVGTGLGSSQRAPKGHGQRRRHATTGAAGMTGHRDLLAHGRQGRRRGGGATLCDWVVFNFNLKFSLPLLLLSPLFLLL